jgi:hypothetical protein
VLDEDVHQADLNLPDLGHLADDFIRDEMEAAGAGTKHNGSLNPHLGSPVRNIKAVDRLSHHGIEGFDAARKLLVNVGLGHLIALITLLQCLDIHH